MIIPFLTLALALGAESRKAPGSTTVIPPTAIPGQSIANFDPFIPKSPFSGIDGPNVLPINNTAFDWWYFDVVALPDSQSSSETNETNDSLASIVVTLFSATNEGFPFLAPTADAENVLTAYFWVTFPNGTLVSRYVHGETAAKVVTSPQGGSSGKFDSTGFSWEGEGDMSRYRIDVDAMDIVGLKGVIELETITSPRLPCSPYDHATPPQNGASNGLRPLEVAPELGWVNPLPDAIGTVDVEIDGSKLQFQGTGYHDKNWSPVPFDPALETWYWGHARVGPYSVVWFDIVRGDGERYISSYVSYRAENENGDEAARVLTLSCGAGSVVVTPREGMEEEGRFDIRFEIEDGDGEGGVLEVDVRPVGILAEAEAGGVGYVRWAGKVVGRVSEEEFEGTSVYEQFVRIEG
ncbi:hypothetical protein FQN54_008775 [Arachnomyces sp. PD_36]|nr:hypothetical protein FQN54_008775 [Arachnomyces sp. PD_36]